ncbi:GbsR/MarR family transcriptional regulator [Pontibacter beigongshangensis]|uniref:GbsR/MarR family transcriptional regulator n=1 Tax=Pontibacter beigongshangensis TaxID=2574733 RepID=UPI0016502FB5|nr:helix-turn-helix domain-containing protein [Pontibacter beigongshangensis]
MGNTLALTERQKELVEKIGIFHEQSGMQPAAARVMGLLFVADKRELTFDDITEVLGISKSATSNAINLLIQTDLIDYTTFSGDRKRYFRLKITNWREGLARKINHMTSMNTLFREVLEARKETGAAEDEKLEELIDFLNYVNQELPKMVERWEARRR